MWAVHSRSVAWRDRNEPHSEVSVSSQRRLLASFADNKRKLLEVFETGRTRNDSEEAFPQKKGGNAVGDDVHERKERLKEEDFEETDLEDGTELVRNVLRMRAKAERNEQRSTTERTKANEKDGPRDEAFWTMPRSASGDERQKHNDCNNNNDDGGDGLNEGQVSEDGSSKSREVTAVSNQDEKAEVGEFQTSITSAIPVDDSTSIPVPATAPTRDRRHMLEGQERMPSKWRTTTTTKPVILCNQQRQISGPHPGSMGTPAPTPTQMIARTAL